MGLDYSLVMSRKIQALVIKLKYLVLDMCIIVLLGELVYTMNTRLQEVCEETGTTPALGTGLLCLTYPCRCGKD